MAIERLESRALLAITISSDVTLPGNIAYQDSDSITVDAGVVLTSTGGKITLDAPSITICDGARLAAAGPVELTATKTYRDLPLSIWGQASTIWQAISGTVANVDVGANVSIHGSSLSILSTAGDNDVVASIPYVGQVIDFAAKLFNDLGSAPVSVQWKQPKTSITIGDGTQIAVSGDVVIHAESTANATGKAIWSTVMDWAVKEKLGWQQQRPSGGAALAFSYADAKATARLREGATITAGGKVEIGTAVTSTADATSRVTLNQGLQKTNPENVEVSYAGARNAATSQVTVDDGAAIVAQKTVDVTAAARDKTSLTVRTDSYRDGLAGVAVGTGFATGTVEVIVNGSITAGQAAVPAPLVFNPALTVDFATRSLVFPDDVGFRTGDSLTYSSGAGGAIPGLTSGRTYWAIYDAARPRQLKLAATAADAAVGVAVDFGAGYPTLAGAGGTVPIVSVNTADDTLWFPFDKWPDGAPLFTDGNTVQYTAVRGRFLGREDASGGLVGGLPDGGYRVQVLPAQEGDPGLRVRLLDTNGAVIRLNDSPQFVTDSGSICQVAAFDADAGTVAFKVPDGAASVSPRGGVGLVNGQRLRYVQGFGIAVPGLVDGQVCFAVVDPATPDIIQLAELESQARAADPAVQDAAPTLETTEPDQAQRRTITIGDIQPGTGLVFGEDPRLSGGTPVVYHAVSGKPVGGLLDGATYYAFPLVNPFFEPNFPQYVVGLRAAPDPSSPLIEYRLVQALATGGDELVINGLDAPSRALSLSLPDPAMVTAADAVGPGGVAASVTAVPAESPQVWTNARGGTFTISLPDGTGRRSTAPIRFDAGPAVVLEAINAVGIAGVNVTTAYGNGRYASPWTLVGSGLDDLDFDWTGLAGGSVWSRVTAPGLQAVATTAAAGAFTLTLDVAGSPRTTVPLAFDATAADVEAAIDGLGGVLAGQVTGSGTVGDPWLIGSRVQPLRTGDAVVFHDVWGTPSPGLIDGQTYYAIVAGIADQGRAGAVVIQLAETGADAAAGRPLSLTTTIGFAAADTAFMSGAQQFLTSTAAATGINLAVTLVSNDAQHVATKNGDQPGLTEVLTRGDLIWRSVAWKSALTRNGAFEWKFWKDNKSSPLAQQIQDKLGGQQANEFVTVSASGSGLHVENTARVVVGPNAVLKTPGSVSLTSKVTETSKSTVEGTLSKPTAGKLGVAVAVDVVQVRTVNHVTVQSGARVSGGGDVKVDAQTVYPWAGQWMVDLVTAFDSSRPLDRIRNAAQRTDPSSLTTNHWANANTSYFYKEQDQQKLQYAIAASVAWVGMSNDTVALVEDGASINQDPAIEVLGGVSVTATTDLTQVGFAGLWKWAKVPVSKGMTALGGSAGYLQIDSTTRALLGGLETDANGRPLRTPMSPLLVDAGGDVGVRATNRTLVIQTALGGVQATNFGFSGMAAVIDGKTGSQVTEAAIVGPADASRKATVSAQGKVDVRADDTTYLIPVAGAVLLSESQGAGVSTAIATLDRGVTARVGSRDDEPDQTVGVVDLTGSAQKNLSVTASAGGAVTPSALAAAIVSPATPSGDPRDVGGMINEPDEDDAIRHSGGEPKGTFGLAVSGDFVLADVRDDVRATVNTTGTIAASATPATLSVSASNTTLILATAGAASYLKKDGDGSSASLAGSAAIVDAASTLIASIRRATVQGYALDVTATDRRQIGSLAASGSGATQQRTGAVNVQVAGSVTVNTLTATTKAVLDGVSGTGLTGVEVIATTSDTIWSAAGSFLFNFSPSGGEAGGKSIGVGEAFALNRVTATTQADVIDSTLTLPTGGMQVEAADTSKLFTFAAGVIVTSAGSSLGGMFSIVATHCTVDASIDGGTVDVAAGDVDVLATTALLLVTAAGDLVVGRGQSSAFAAGAAVAVVGGTITSDAKIRRGSVRVRRGGLSVTSRTNRPESDPAIDQLLADVYTPHRDETAVWTFALGVVWSQSTLTANFSVCWNTLDSERSASIDTSATVAVDDGSLAVHAIDEGSIYTGAGAIAMATGDLGKVAVGAALAHNSLAGTTSATIRSAHVTVSGSGAIDVAATGAALIAAAAVGGEVAGKAAVGTAVVLNDITQSIDARITGSEGTRSVVAASGAITVTATERSKIGAGAGQVDVATRGVGAGAAAATNTVNSTVNAIVEESNVVSSAGAMSVTADAAGRIFSYAVGVAGAFDGEIVQFAGVGSGTGNTLVRQVTAAVQSKAVVESHGLSVTANDTSTIDTAAGTLAIQFSGRPGTSAAIGISASTNTVGSTSDTDRRSFVQSMIDDATVSVHGALAVTAKAGLAIQAITAAGAGNFGGSQSASVGIAGAGAGSGNDVQMDAVAAVRNAAVVQNSIDPSSGVTIKATNETAVFALAGGVAAAGSTPGNTQGVGVEIGAAATVNTVTLVTTAAVEGATTIGSPGKLLVAATSDGSIKAVSFGVAAALRTGGSRFDLSGAGSAAVNTVTRDTTAAIRPVSGQAPTVGSVNQPLASVSVTAGDTSSIVAGAGGLASLFSFGQGSSLGLSIGVSLTVNEVHGTVASDIDGASVRTAGAVDVAASVATGQHDANVWSVAVAGAVGVSVGNSALFPLAGAGSRNTVDVATSATISGGANLQAGGAVGVAVSDHSKTYLNSGGIGLGLSFDGRAGVAVAVGAAYGKNDIANTTEAMIEGATVTAAAGVSVVATATPEIASVGYGVAVTVAQALLSASAAGSGASAFNTIRNTVAAAVLSSSVKAAAGDVVVHAEDTPKITTRAGAGSLAIAIGNGVALAPGVVVLESSVADTVTARIGRSAPAAAAPTITATTGLVDVAALSKANVSSLGVAVAATVAVGEATGAFAGAGAHGTVALASTITAAIDAGTVTGARVSVAAVDGDAATENTIGTGAGAFGDIGGSIGVSLAETRAANSVTATIGAAAVTATSGGITVDVRGGHSLATETVATSVAVAIGGAGAGGHAFVTDQSTYRATVAPGSALRATGTLLVQARGSSDDTAAPDGRLDAQAHGGAAGLVAVGVVIARATDDTRREAEIGDGVDLSGVAALDVLAAANPTVHAHSIAVDVGAVAVTVNQSQVTTSGRVAASTGTGVTLPRGDVRIIATGTAELDAQQKGAVDGVLAAGATQTTGQSGLVTEAILGAATRTASDRPGGLVVRAASQDDTTIGAIAGSGGFFSGFGTSGELTDTTKTRATILGGTIHAGAVDVGVSRRNQYLLDVSSANITVLVGVGVTRATFEADRTAADGLDRVRVAIAADTNLTALDGVTVTAEHRIERPAGDTTVSGVGGAILAAGQQAASTVTAHVPATIALGDRVAITSGTNALSRPGGINLLPSAALEVHDSVSLSNLGLLVSGGRMSATLTGGVFPLVTMGDDVTLVSHGQLNVGTTAFVSSSTSTNGWGCALFGGIGTFATSRVTVEQRVAVGQRARFSSDGSLSVTPGDEATAGWPTFLSLDATARASSTGVVAIPDAKARTTLSHTASLSFGSGADVSSGGNMYLSARAVKPVVTATGEAEGNIFFVPKTVDDAVASGPSSSSVTLAGSFVAGRENKLEIVIPNDRAGGFTDTVQVSPATVFGVPVAATYLPDFNPTASIDRWGFTPEVAAALKSGVAPGTVGAISFESSAPLLVSGGSVMVTGQTISAGTATIAARNASITVRNDSPDYLILGRMAIANVDGGRVSFQDLDGKVVADPAGASIFRDPTATPTITVDLTYDRGVGGSTYGPAVFVTDALENMGGDVTIRDAAGSFGQKGTIAAKRIVIDTPNGVFAVDTPNAAWNAAGTPAAQVASQMVWPGGNPSLGRANANQAVMYAINAMDGYRDAGNDDALNARVYGNPLAVVETTVFFGGSTPQFNFDSNTQNVNENWAAGSRPDGARQALLMTTSRPPDVSSWDHAWVPRLQYLPNRFTVATLPSQGGTTAVKGQVIIVNAKVANINGGLEAGGDQPQTQSVLIPASLESVLLAYQQQYRAGAVNQAVYRIPDDRLETQSLGDRLIGASFDARTGQIVLDSAVSGGGGSVSITGRIINTDALAGKIRVHGGSGDITVVNGTHLAIQTGTLQTAREERQAIVSLTDLDVADPSQQQTTYVYDGGQILVYRGARGADLPAESPVRARIAGTATTFHPEPNARWQWRLTADMNRTVNDNSDRFQRDWPGVDVTGWSFANPDSPWQTAGGVGAGDVVFDTVDAYAFRQELTADRPFSGSSFAVPYQNTPPNNWTGFSADHRFFYPDGVSLTMTMSLKADWPIGIDFGGVSFGEVSVDSVGDVVVGGRTVATAVWIWSREGRVLATNAGAVETSRLVVEANGGVGGSSSPLAISAEDVLVENAAGDVCLDASRSAGPLGLRGVSAPGGSVSIVAAGDILLAGDILSIDGPLLAAAVSLNSLQGRIGSLQRPIVVDAGRGPTLRLDASAVGDIHVSQISHAGLAASLLVGSVVSSGGDVMLAAVGNIYNADTWTIDPVAADRRMAALIALGATNPDAYQADVSAFERSVTSQYSLFWSTRTNATKLSLWRLRTAVALGIADPRPGNPTDDQIRAYVTDLQGDLAAFFADTIGPDWAGLPQFQAFDPAYVYTATPAQVEHFRKDRTVSAAQLSLQLRARALDAPPPGEAVQGRVNISARSIQLTSTSGAVGMNDPPIMISAADLAAGNLTAQQRQELALAANPGDATLTKDGGLVLTVRRPIILAVRDRVDVNGPAGVAIAQKDGDVHVGHVTSQNGLVSVIADGSILNAPSTIDMWGPAIGFDRPEEWSCVGTAGQNVSAQEGLVIPAYKNAASGTWFKDQVGTGSFRVSFTYQASDRDEAGNGLAFVLQTNGTAAVGAAGDGLGYKSIPGRKVGFLINLNQNIPQAYPPGVAFDKDGGWAGGGFTDVNFSLRGRPIYVTLVYDAVAGTMTATLALQPQPIGVADRSQTITWRGIDLAAVLGPTAYMGFTSGTGYHGTTQQVTQLSFSDESQLAGERVTFSGQEPWVTSSSDPNRGGFVLTTPPDGPTLQFPDQPGLAAAAWYPRPVRVSTDFRITFRYWYDSRSGVAGDGLAIVLQNGPDGVAARGTAGSGLGYTGIPGKKVGYLINIHPDDPFAPPARSGIGSRFDTVGSAGGPYHEFALPEGVWIDVTLTYDATAHTLKDVLTWTPAHGSVITLRQGLTGGVDLPVLLGATTATLGVTAASGDATAAQMIRSLEFTSPSASSHDDDHWELNGSVQWIADGHLTIPAVDATATSSWFGRPVSTDGFTADFTYRSIPSSIPFGPGGIGFVLQSGPQGYSALGNSNGIAGYSGLPGPKVGLLIDTVGLDIFVAFSTGSDAVDPERLPWSLTGPVAVRIVYDAQSLTFTATLTRAGADPFTRSWTGVDLGRMLGPQAIMGFTSGTSVNGPTQIVGDFLFHDRDGIDSFKPVTGTAPTVRLWSTQGDIGSSGDEINVHGRLEANAPKGEIHTNPPPTPSVSVAAVGLRPNGIGVVRSPQAFMPVASAGHRLLFSINGGRTWRSSFRAVEGMNDVLVIQVNTRGFRSAPQHVRFVLDRKPPAPPRLVLVDRVYGWTRTGQVRVVGLERSASVQYSVNGRPWSSSYVPVEGLNVVRVRQIDLAGNASKPAVAVFILKTRVHRLAVSLARDLGGSVTGHVSRDGRLVIRGRERGATVQYSVDGGRSWQRQFRAVVGVNRLHVRQVDRVGNVSQPTPFEFQLVSCAG